MFDIIDEMMKDRLDIVLQLMAYLDQVVSIGVIDFLDVTFFNDLDMQKNIFSEELPIKKNKQFFMESPLAEKLDSRMMTSSSQVSN